MKHNKEYNKTNLNNNNSERDTIVPYCNYVIITII